MVDTEFVPAFQKDFIKLRDKVSKEKIEKQIAKIIENPEIGKPMRFARKNTRELHVSPYRLSYEFIKSENLIRFLSIYHKDEQ